MESTFLENYSEPKSEISGEVQIDDKMNFERFRQQKMERKRQERQRREEVKIPSEEPNTVGDSAGRCVWFRLETWICPKTFRISEERMNF